MGAINADSTFQLAQPDPAATFLLVNNDDASPVYISQSRPVNALDTQLPAQGSATLTGTWYVSTLSQSTVVQCFVLPGGLAWSNPVGVQVALSALGLALNSTVEDLPANIQAMGVPPTVPNATAAKFRNAGATSTTGFKTFGTDVFIWAAVLTYAITTDGTFASGVTSVSSYIETGSGISLAIVELAASSTDQVDSGVSSLTFNGIALSSGDELNYNINSGNTYTGMQQRASGIVVYSTP